MKPQFQPKFSRRTTNQPQGIAQHQANVPAEITQLTYPFKFAHKRPLTPEETGRVMKNVSGNIALFEHIHSKIDEKLPINREAFLKKLLTKMHEGHYNPLGLHLTGSSLRASLAGQEKTSDLDFSLILGNLNEQFRGVVEDDLTRLIVESIYEVSDRTVPKNKISKLFKNIIRENPQYQSACYLFFLGHKDTDLLTSSKPPNYAFAHQGQSLDLLPCLVFGQSPELISWEKNTKDDGIMRTRDDGFIHWTHINQVAKHLGKGYRFEDPITAKKYYNSALSALESSKSNSENDSYTTLSSSFNALETNALLGMALDFPNRANKLDRYAKKSKDFFCSILSTALMTKQGRYTGLTDQDKQARKLISCLTSQHGKDFFNTSENLQALLALYHFTSSPNPNCKPNVEGLSNRFSIDTEIAGLKLNVTFDSDGLQKSTRYQSQPLGSTQYKDDAFLLINDWDDNQIDQVYRLAQELNQGSNLSKVISYIENYRRASSATASLTKDAEVKKTTEIKTDKASKPSKSTKSSKTAIPNKHQPALSPIRDGRWFIGNRSYELCKLSKSTISENGLPTGKLTIKVQGKDIVLENFTANDNGTTQADLSMKTEYKPYGQEGLKGQASTKVNIDQYGEIRVISEDPKTKVKVASAIDFGVLSFSGGVKGIYSSKGDLLGLQPDGDDVLFEIKGEKNKPNVKIKGDILTNGQLQVKSIDEEPIQANYCYVQWNELSDLSHCDFEMEKTLDEVHDLQMNAKHKLVSKKIPLEEDSSNSSTKGNRKGRKKSSAKGKSFQWKSHLIPTDGELFIKGFDQRRLKYSSQSEQVDGIIVLSDARKNGFISYELGHELDQKLVTTVSVELNDKLSLVASNREEKQNFASATQQGSSHDIQGLLTRTAVDHLTGKNVRGHHFRAHVSSDVKKPNLVLTNQHLNLSHAGDRLEISQLNAALPLDNSQQKKRAGRSRSAAGQNQSRTLRFNHIQPTSVWSMDGNKIGLKFSSDRLNEVTLPLQSDKNGYHYLLRYEGDLSGDTLQPGVNVSTITLLKHPLRDPTDLDAKLHPSDYSKRDQGERSNFVQLKQHLSTMQPSLARPNGNTPAPTVTHLEMRSDELMATCNHNDELVLQPIDTTYYGGHYIADDDGEPKLIPDQKPRRYPKVSFSQNVISQLMSALQFNRTGNLISQPNLFSGDLALKPGMEITLKEGHSDLKATSIMVGEYYKIEGIIMPKQGEMPFCVQATKNISSSNVEPFSIKITQGNRVKELSVNTHSATVDGLDEFDDQQRKFIELVETAMRATITYKEKMEPSIKEAKELINLDTSKIKLPINRQE